MIVTDPNIRFKSVDSSNDKIGVQVSAYFRAMLNYYADIDWKECEQIGKIFNDYLMDADWLSLDDGTTFDRK